MIDLLIRAAEAGGREAQRCLPTAYRAVEKGDGDFATNADLASQEVILDLLAREVPSIPIIAEEDAVHDDHLPSEYICVDPFDGTVIGSRGLPEWGVLLAYVKESRAQAGVVYQPARGKLLFAERGKGAFHRDRSNQSNRLDFTKRQTVPGGRIMTTFELNYRTELHQIEKLLLPIVANKRMLLNRAMGSAASATMELADGAIELYVNPAGGKIWDYAPGSLIVEEAGGTVLFINRLTAAVEPFRWDRIDMGAIFCVSPALAHEILKLFDI